MNSNVLECGRLSPAKLARTLQSCLPMKVGFSAWAGRSPLGLDVAWRITLVDIEGNRDVHREGAAVEETEPAPTARRVIVTSQGTEKRDDDTELCIL